MKTNLNSSTTEVKFFKELYIVGLNSWSLFLEQFYMSRPNNRSKQFQYQIKEHQMAELNGSLQTTITRFTEYTDICL